MKNFTTLKYVNYDNSGDLKEALIASFTFWLLSFTFGNSGGCQNRLLFKNGIVGVLKVQMLASNISESNIVCTSGNKFNKDFRPSATFK